MVKETEGMSPKVRNEAVNGSVDHEFSNEDGKEKSRLAAVDPNDLQSVADIDGPETSGNTQNRGEDEVDIMLLDEHADLLLKDKSGMSLLLCAVEKGQLGIFTLLFEEMENRGCCPLDMSDNNKDTAAHQAAAFNQLNILKYLLNKDEGILLTRNNDSQTPLQLAVARGSLNTVKFLVERAPADTLDKEFFLQDAIKQGHHDTVGYLLKALPTDRIGSPQQLMDESLNIRDRKMVRLILKSKHCKKALTKQKTYSRMIRKMADETRMAMDDCIVEHGEDLTVDFSMFTSGESLKTMTLSVPLDDPIKTIIDSADENMICHPTFLSYISEMWKSTRVFYWFWLLCMLTFASIVSANVILRTKSVTTRNPSPTQSILVTPLDANETFRCDWLDPDQQNFLVVSSVIIMVAACLGIVIELLQLIVSKFAYFTKIGNWFDMSMYVLCLTVTVNLRRCYEPTDWQWDLAPFAVLVTWFDVLFSMKGLPVCGLYICMVSDILTSFLRFLIVGVLFVLAFAISFSILLHDLPPFESVYQAFPTMWVMATGELGYTDLFHAGELGQESPLGHQAAAGFCLLLIFVFVMTIIIANLMIGLAVEDVSRLRQQAKIQMVKIRAELFLEMKYLHLPMIAMKALGRKILKKKEHLKTKTSTTYKNSDQFEFIEPHWCRMIINWKDDLMDRDYIRQRALDVVRRDNDGTMEHMNEQLQSQQQQLQSIKELIEGIRDQLLPKAIGEHPTGKA